MVIRLSGMPPGKEMAAECKKIMQPLSDSSPLMLKS